MRRAFRLTSVAPTSLAFPTQRIGTLSTPKADTLTVSCTTLMDLGGHSACTSYSDDQFSVSLATTGDFAATSNCPATMAPVFMTWESVSCTISLTFTPTALGSRTGTSSTGTGPSDAGPTVALSGIELGSATAIPKRCKKRKKKSSGSGRHASAAKKKRCRKHRH
jgi:hypothetical protein